MKYSRILGVTLIVSGFAAWMATSDILTQPSPTDSEQDNPASTNDRFAVVVEKSQAQTQFIEHDFIGRLEAQNDIPVVARLEGTISQVFIKPGDVVEPGQVLFKIKSDTLPSRLRQIDVQLEEAKQNLRAIRAMHAKSYASDTELRAAVSAFESAQSAKASVQEDLQNSVVRAPSRGKAPLDLPSEGDYVDVKTNLATLSSVGDYKISLNVPPSQAKLIKDSELKVTIGGDVLKGNVIAISGEAAGASIGIDVVAIGSQARVPGEIAVVTAREAIENGHEIDGKLVEISDLGNSIVKVLNGDVVEILEIDDVRFADNKLILSGLPEEIDLIVRGGGFVTQGETVDVRRVTP